MTSAPAMRIGIGLPLTLPGSPQPGQVDALADALTLRGEGGRLVSLRRQGRLR